jgi:hypothetical protein
VEGINTSIDAIPFCDIAAINDALCDGPPEPLFRAITEGAAARCAFTESDEGLHIDVAASSTRDAVLCAYTTRAEYQLLDRAIVIPLDVAGIIDANGDVVDGFHAVVSVPTAFIGFPVGALIQRNGSNDTELACGFLTAGLDALFDQDGQGGEPPSGDVVELDAAPRFLRVTVQDDQIVCDALDAQSDVLVSTQFGLFSIGTPIGPLTFGLSATNDLAGGIVISAL